MRNQKMNGTRKKNGILLVYIIMCVCFIWGQSLLPGTQSSEESSFVMDEVVHPIEEAVFGQATSTEQQVRKAAHVFEFTMLGMGLAAFFGLAVSMGNHGSGTAPADAAAVGPDQNADAWKRRGTVLFRSLSAGLFIALIDETIQIFSGRGPMIADVWIDGFGVLQGTVLVLFLQWLFGRWRKKETENV